VRVGLAGIALTPNGDPAPNRERPFGPDAMRVAAMTKRCHSDMALRRMETPKMSWIQLAVGIISTTHGA
jgi:hypothetical protein